MEVAAASGAERHAATSWSPSHSTYFGIWATVLLLFNLAMSQPLLDLLGRNAEFFVAWDLSGLALVAFALVVTIALPTALAAIVWLALAVNRWLGTLLHWALLGILTTALAIQLLKRMPVVSTWAGWTLVACAAVAGAAAVLAYTYSRSLRSILAWGWPVPLLVAGFFLVLSPASRLVFASTPTAAADVTVANPVPIVLVVFDELPLASLMTADGEIDEHLYPNFARLADDATWFRNATTVYDNTGGAVPAIVDGRYPVKGKLPVASDHPYNLFTLLAGSHDINAHEAMTALCPDTVCPRTSSGRSHMQVRGIASDTRVVLSHLLYPREWTQQLPSLDEAWANFESGRSVQESDFGWRERRQAADQANKPALFAAAVATIRPVQNARPDFFFLHSALPHRPFQYLSDGRAYPERGTPGYAGHRWSDNSWLVHQAYQRHLLQVALVDRLLGSLLDRLQQTGRYDDALIIVTADHGIAFRPGSPVRGVRPQTVGQIAAVPLFVKRPAQREGATVDRPVETIDILPTVADVVGLSGSRDLPGHPLFAADDPRPQRQVGTNVREVGSVSPDASVLPAVQHFAANKYRWFGAAGAPMDLYGLAPGESGRLLGEDPGAVDLLRSGDARAMVENLDTYQDLDLSAVPFPSWIAGQYIAPAQPQSATVLAIAVNDRIAAITRTYEGQGGETRFYAMLPPEAFDAGRNDVAVYEVTGFGTGDFQLRSIRTVASQPSVSSR